MGGDNGTADIAVGGHGIELPPGRPKTGREDRRGSQSLWQAQSSLDKAMNTAAPPISHSYLFLTALLGLTTRPHPPLNPTPPTHPSPSSCGFPVCLFRFPSPSTWIMCTQLSKHPSLSLLLVTDPAQQPSSHRSTLLAVYFHWFKVVIPSCSPSTLGPKTFPICPTKLKYALSSSSTPQRLRKHSARCSGGRHLHLCQSRVSLGLIRSTDKLGSSRDCFKITKSK